MMRMTLCVLAVLAAAPAQAGCREDLIAADQNIHRTRSELQKAAAAAPAVKCQAYRRHVASLTQIRAVFAKCDTSADKAKNAAQTSSAIAEFNKQAQANCRQAAPAAKPAAAAKPAQAPAPSIAPPPPLPVPR